MEKLHQLSGAEASHLVRIFSFEQHISIYLKSNDDFLCSIGVLDLSGKIVIDICGDGTGGVFDLLY